MNSNIETFKYDNRIAIDPQAGGAFRIAAQHGQFRQRGRGGGQPEVVGAL